MPRPPHERDPAFVSRGGGGGGGGADGGGPPPRRRIGAAALLGWVLAVALAVAGAMATVLLVWPLRARLQATEDALADATGSAARLQSHAAQQSAALRAQEDEVAHCAEALAAVQAREGALGQAEAHLAETLAAPVQAHTVQIARREEAVVAVAPLADVLELAASPAPTPLGEQLVAAAAAVLQQAPDVTVEIRVTATLAALPPRARRHFASPWGLAAAGSTVLAQATLRALPAAAPTAAATRLSAAARGREAGGDGPAAADASVELVVRPHLPAAAVAAPPGAVPPGTVPPGNAAPAKAPPDNAPPDNAPPAGETVAP